MSRPVRRTGARWAAVVVALVGVFAFYSWTALTSARAFPAQMDVGGRSYFNLQVDAFLDGDIALPVKPSPELLALEDPYDEAHNAPFRLHDLALFEGRYYLYWGPTPVLTLFGPARLLLGRDLSERAAILIYACAGLLASLALLRFLVNRYLPGVPSWMLWAAGWVLATSNFVVFVLRRPTVYEVAVLAGFCFSMWAVYLLFTGALAERLRWARLAGAGICLALATGARPNLAAGAVLAVAVLVHLVRRRKLETLRQRLGGGALLLGPVALALALLLLYNKVRFGSFAEFGISYQLNHIGDPLPRGGLAHVMPGLYYYLVAPPRPVLTFPFVHLPPPPSFPGTTPTGYALEPTGGLVACSPIVVAATATLALFTGRCPHPLRELRLLALGLFATVAVLVGFLVFAIYGVAGRYSVDFSTLVLVPALLGWMALSTLLRNTTWRRLVAGGGAVLVAYGSLVGLAVGFTGATDALRQGNPELYESLEDFFSPLPTAAAAVAGGPILTEVRSPSGVDRAVTYLTFSAGAETLHLGRQPAMVEITSPRRDGATITGMIRVAARDAPASMRLIVQLPDSDRARTLPVRPGMLVAPVELRRGVNRIQVRIEGAPPPAPGESYDEPLASIHELRVEEDRRTAQVRSFTGA